MSSEYSANSNNVRRQRAADPPGVAATPAANGTNQGDDNRTLLSSARTDDRTTTRPASENNDINNEKQIRVNLYDLAQENSGPDYKHQVLSERDQEQQRQQRQSNRASGPSAAADARPTRASSSSKRTAATTSVDVLSGGSSVPFASNVRLVPEEELGGMRVNDDDDNSNDEKPSSRWTKNALFSNRRRVWIVALVCAVLIVVVVVGAIVGGSGGGTSDSNASAELVSAVPTASPITPLPTVCDLATTIVVGATSGTSVALDETNIGRVCGPDEDATSAASMNGAWYQVMGTGGVLKLSTQLDTFLGRMSLYSGDCTNTATAPVVVVATDLACEGFYPAETDGHSITWLSIAGQPYLLFVHSQDSEPGAEFVFNLEEVDGPMEFRVFQDSAYAITSNLYSGDLARELTSAGSGYLVCGRLAELVVITSPEENAFVTSFASELNNNDFFTLGGFQTGKLQGDTADTWIEGWQWIGTHGNIPFYNYTTPDNNYANWDDGEPDQRENYGDEDCLALWTANGKWHDRLCNDVDYPFRFFVEVELAESRSVMVGDCDTGLDTDPLISIEMGDDGQYVCTYLSHAISDLEPVGFQEDSLAALLNDTKISAQLSAEQQAAVFACAA